jgi:hypothetical protein
MPSQHRVYFAAPDTGKRFAQAAFTAGSPRRPTRTGERCSPDPRRRPGVPAAGTTGPSTRQAPPRRSSGAPPRPPEGPRPPAPARAPRQPTRRCVTGSRCRPHQPPSGPQSSRVRGRGRRAGDIVLEAPPTVLAGLVGADQGIVGVLGQMPARAAVGGADTAVDVTARHAQAEMHPPAAAPKASPQPALMAVTSPTRSRWLQALAKSTVPHSGHRLDACLPPPSAGRASSRSTAASSTCPTTRRRTCSTAPSHASATTPPEAGAPRDQPPICHTPTTFPATSRKMRAVAHLDVNRGARARCGGGDGR